MRPVSPCLSWCVSGNNAAEGQRLLTESGLTVEAVNSLDDAAKRIIALLN